MVVGLEVVDYPEKERMLGNRAHYVVGYAGGHRAPYPRRVCEKRIQAAVATLGGATLELPRSVQTAGNSPGQGLYTRRRSERVQSTL